jgi:GNAT superfamily N-acetyltransferase
MTLSDAADSVAGMHTTVTDEPQMSRFQVLPAGDAPFADVEAVFGTRGDPAHCWCQWYKIPGSNWRGIGDEALRDRLETQFATSGSGPGLLAYDGDTPVGWCAVESRSNLPRLTRSRIVAGGTQHPDFHDPDIWAVTCFVIPRAHRRKGVARVLAEAAATYAREHGARVIEGYAVDPDQRANPQAADLFHGTVTMFLNAGFEEVARPKADRVILERRLDVP